MLACVCVCMGACAALHLACMYVHLYVHLASLYVLIHWP